MKQLITNKDNLKEEDMTELEIRVKILLLNSNKEILIGYSYDAYQFVGGHIEDGEEFFSTIKREIQEETGITIIDQEIKPFAVAIGYYKDWPKKDHNKKVEIYYYEIFTDQKPDLTKTNYTESEKEGKFELRYIPLENLEKEVLKNVKEHGDNSGIAKEILELLKYYRSLK